MIQTITAHEYSTVPKNPTTPTFCDIESEDLYVNCSLIQLRNNGQSYLVRTNLDSEVEVLKKHMKPLHLVFWNGSYDMGLLEMVPDKVDDLFYAVKIAYPTIGDFSLGNVVKALGFGYLYEGLDKKGLQKKGFVRHAYLSQEQLRYAAADVEALELIWAMPKVQEVINNNLAYKLGMFAQEEAMQWQQNGLPVIASTVTKYIEEVKVKIAKSEADMITLIGRPLNPRSPKQVTAFFGTNSSDKATLTRIVINGNIVASRKSSTGRGIDQCALTFTPAQQEVAESILFGREAKNTLSKLERYVGKKKMYGRFNPMGATTSRWTCKGTKKGSARTELFNAQNYSRSFKSVFGVAEGSGLIIVAADFATLEVRIAAAIMNEPNMYQALKDGKDIHKSTASLIFGKPLDEIDGRERSNAKVANFGLTYGMGLNVFIQYAFDLYGIKFTDAEAKDLIAKFFKAYPGLKRYHNMVGKGMKRGGYVCQTALGYKMKPDRYAEAINGPTQGTGGEVMRLAIHLLVRKDQDALKYIVNSIHDAAYLVVPEEHKNYWGSLLELSMKEAWAEISKSELFVYHDIPMAVDVMYGYTMGELEEGFAGGGQALSVAEMREQQARSK